MTTTFASLCIDTSAPPPPKTYRLYAQPAHRRFARKSNARATKTGVWRDLQLPQAPEQVSGFSQRTSFDNDIFASMDSRPTHLISERLGTNVRMRYRRRLRSRCRLWPLLLDLIRSQPLTVRSLLNPSRRLVPVLPACPVGTSYSIAMHNTSCESRDISIRGLAPSLAESS